MLYSGLCVKSYTLTCWYVICFHGLIIFLGNLFKSAWKHNKAIFSIYICAKGMVISEIFLFPSWLYFFLGPSLAPHPLDDDVMPMGSSPTQLELKWFPLVILECGWPESVAHTTLFEVLTLEICNLSPGCRGPLVLTLEIWQPHLHSCCPDSAFYYLLSLYSDVWVEKWGARGVRGWRGSILSYCLPRRRGLDRKIFHYLESSGIDSLYLCNIFVVSSLISQLCSF